MVVPRKRLLVGLGSAISIYIIIYIIYIYWLTASLMIVKAKALTIFSQLLRSFELISKKGLVLIIPV